jgi:phosphoketolase
VKINTLTPELQRMHAYWRAANYLSVAQIYLCDALLLKHPPSLADVKHMLLGHWGTIQQPALEICRGHHDKVVASQQELFRRVECNQAARLGEYNAQMETT